MRRGCSPIRHSFIRRSTYDCILFSSLLFWLDLDRAPQGSWWGSPKRFRRKDADDVERGVLPNKHQGPFACRLLEVRYPLGFMLVPLSSKPLFQFFKRTAGGLDEFGFGQNAARFAQDHE